MHLVHLTASSFFGGPERQMLGLGRHLPHGYASTYVTFHENGRSAPFAEQVRQHGFTSVILENDTPHLRAALRELTDLLQAQHASVLICHGYKSNLLGRLAARRVGVPVVSVSRGWTGENFKVRLYDRLDRFHLRYMDAVVAVSDGQAAKVLRTGLARDKLTIIRNAARLDAFRTPNPEFRDRLREMANAGPDDLVLLAAGRLSPEKGFHILVDAMAKLKAAGKLVRTVLFGDGVQRTLLERQVEEAGLSDHFKLVGFHQDLDNYLPWADMMTLPSFTEGLPNVALEASAAGVPVVATAVGGTPEVVRDGLNGFLVPPGDIALLAERIGDLCDDGRLRQKLGDAGERLMRDEFSFAGQADAYRRLFDRLLNRSSIPALVEAA